VGRNSSLSDGKHVEKIGIYELETDRQFHTLSLNIALAVYVVDIDAKTTDTIAKKLNKTKSAFKKRFSQFLLFSDHVLARRKMPIASANQLMMKERLERSKSGM
jgi:ribosomal protein S16